MEVLGCVNFFHEYPALFLCLDPRRNFSVVVPSSLTNIVKRSLGRLAGNKTSITQRNLGEIMALFDGEEYRPKSEQKKNDNARTKRNAPADTGVYFDV